MKITETEKGNIKIVMSREHAEALYNLLDKLEFEEYEKFTSKEESYKLYDLWVLIETAYIEI